MSSCVVVLQTDCNTAMSYTLCALNHASHKTYVRESTVRGIEFAWTGILQDDREHKWRIQAVSESAGSFINRKSLPKAWQGLRDAELDKVSGIPGGFLALSQQAEHGSLKHHPASAAMPGSLLWGLCKTRCNPILVT